MSAHTPGMWSWTRSEAFLNQWGVGHDLYSCAVRVGDQCIAIVAHDGMTEAQSEANARLIAAAPELRDSLAKYVEFFSGRYVNTDPEFQAMRAEALAVLVKAEGK